MKKMDSRKISCFMLVIAVIILSVSPSQSTYDSCRSNSVRGSIIFSQAVNDMQPPIIVNVTHTPRYPQPNDRVIITAKVRDDSSGVKEVKIEYRWRLNFNWYGQNRYWGIYEWTWEPLTWNVYTDWKENTMMSKQDNNYEFEMMELSYYTRVWYKITAIDNVGNSAESEVYVYNVVNGIQTVIQTEVSSTLNWVLYISITLLLVRGLGGATPKKKGKELKDRAS